MFYRFNPNVYFSLQHFKNLFLKAGVHKFIPIYFYNVILFSQSVVSADHSQKIYDLLKNVMEIISQRSQKHEEL
jgi:hypothetical protein